MFRVRDDRLEHGRYKDDPEGNDAYGGRPAAHTSGTRGAHRGRAARRR